MFLKFAVLLSILIPSLANGRILYAETLSLQSRDVTVLYERKMEKAAREVVSAYPAVRDGLSGILDRKIEFSPEILIKEGDTFRRIAGNDVIVAFAVPGRNLIVLDASRVYTKPFALESTLKHELCHLVIHHEAGDAGLPRWFDEGVCQWASGGVAELMVLDGDKALSQAVRSNKMIGLSELAGFPDDEQSLVLAYEEAKSAVEYIANKHGREGILHILEHLRDGDSMEESMAKGLSLELTEFERAWKADLKRKYTWFPYLSENLYTILFTLAALMTFYGFLRLLRKKREYVDEDEEGDGGDDKASPCGHK